MIAATLTNASNDVLRDRDLLSLPFGGSSLRHISDTTPVTGLNAFALVPTIDTVFATLTPITGFDITGKTGKNCPAGIAIFVSVSAITLTSGAVDVYSR